MERDNLGGGVNTMQYTEDVLWNYIPETYIILIMSP